MPAHDTLPVTWLLRAAEKYPNHTALVTQTGKLNFGDLYTHVTKLAAWVTRRGLRSGKILAIVSDSSEHIAWASYLALYVGCPLLPLNVSRRESMKLLQTCRVTQAIVDTDLYDYLPPGIHLFPADPLTATLSHDDSYCAPSFTGGIQLIVPTSGTTGEFRGVMLSNENLHASVQSSQERLGLCPGDTWLNCLPLFHIGGLSILYRCLHRGATVLLHHRFDPATVWHDLKHYDVTHLSLVPVMLLRLLDCDEDIRRISSLRVVLVGGGPLSSELAHRATRAGWPIYPTYGMSETASQIATLQGITEAWQAGDVGKPLPGITVDIVDDTGQITSARGRIRISGHTVMMGYANNKEIDAAGLDDGTFISNDIGYVDDRGHLHVVGRADDILIVGGENIHPQEIEDRLQACPGVKDIALTSQMDNVWGQRLVAFFCGSAEETVLSTWCETHLARTHRPSQFVKVIDRLPRNALGKLDRIAIRKMCDRAFHFPS